MTIDNMTDVSIVLSSYIIIRLFVHLLLLVEKSSLCDSWRVEATTLHNATF